MPKALDSTELPNWDQHLQAYLDIVNELLPGAPAIGAYCMGMSGPFIRSLNPRVWPTRELLMRLRECGTVEGAMRVMEEWIIAAGEKGENARSR